MANFNFGSIANMNGVASDKALRPYQIHNVTFDKVTVEDLEAKQGANAGKIFKVLKLRFSNSEGYYEDTFFLPDENNSADFERQPNNWGGQTASNFDRLKVYIAHVSSAINPEGFNQLKTIASQGKIKNVDDLVKLFVKIISTKEGKSNLSLKLVGRNSNGTVRATLPYFCNINKDGVEYLSNNFLVDGDVEHPITLSFTKNELAKKVEYENLKPTNMQATSPVSEAPATTTSGSEDNSDLLGLINEM